MKTNKAIKEVMKTAAEEAGFNYIVAELKKTSVTISDSDSDDNYIDVEIFHTTSKNMTEKEYKKMQKDIDMAVVKGAGFEVYAWNDISGYDYWTVQQEEDNYIQISARIKDASKVDVSKLEDAINYVQGKLSHYSRF